MNEYNDNCSIYKTSYTHNPNMCYFYILAVIAYSNVAEKSPDDIEQYIAVRCQSKALFNGVVHVGVSIVKHNNSHG